MDLYRRGDRLLFLSFYKVFFWFPMGEKVISFKSVLSLVRGRKGMEIEGGLRLVLLSIVREGRR